MKPFKWLTKLSVVCGQGRSFEMEKMFQSSFRYI